MKKACSLMSSLMCVLLVTLFCISTAPAHAAENTSEFDFSAVDALNKYDSYTKKTINERSCVEVTKINRIDTRSTTTFSSYRYGAYLRNSGDLQYYSISNPKYRSEITSNVLTIYADPEVHFEVTDATNKVVANDKGTYSKNLVQYYHKSTDNGHSVYYIEFVPQNTVMVKFNTDSTSVQPHYSFWFGHPVTRSETSRKELVEMAVVKPRTSSAEYECYSPYIQDQAWVTSVTVEKRSENDKACVSSAYIALATPETTEYSEDRNTDSTKIVFDYDVSSTSAHIANGVYNFKISEVNWKSQTSGSACYTYKGYFYITYLYAFGYQ